MTIEELKQIDAPQPKVKKEPLQPFPKVKEIVAASSVRVRVPSKSLEGESDTSVAIPRPISAETKRAAVAPQLHYQTNLSESNLKATQLLPEIKRASKAKENSETIAKIWAKEQQARFAANPPRVEQSFREISQETKRQENSGTIGESLALEPAVSAVQRRAGSVLDYIKARERSAEQQRTEPATILGFLRASRQPAPNSEVLPRKNCEKSLIPIQPEQSLDLAKLAELARKMSFLSAVKELAEKPEVISSAKTVPTSQTLYKSVPIPILKL